MPRHATYPRGLDWQGVDSSNISQAAHDPETQTLYVKFHNGNIYSYDDVPATVFRYFIDAASAGEYFHRNIRMSYTYHKLA